MKAAKRQIMAQLSADLDTKRTTVWQDKPWTAVCVFTTYNDLPYQAFGFSKVNWPDRWDAEYGIGLAINKALARIARQIISEAMES